MTIYLDNAATTFPKPDVVCDAVAQAMRLLTANPGRGGHKQALDAARQVLATREAVARFFGVVDSSRVVFTPSATQAINQGLFGLLKAGDRVLTTSMEHNAVVRPLRQLQDQGVEVVKVAADQAGFVDPADMMAAATPKPRLIIMTHCSNVTGTVQEIAEIGNWCRSQGILFMVDAAQSAGLLPIHVEQMGIDLLAAAGHKGLMGPPGTGFLYVRPDLDLQPLVYGGTGVLSDSDRQPEQLPERLESGTLNTVGLAGLGAALDFIEREGRERIRTHEVALVQQLLQGLSKLTGVTLYGPLQAERHGSVVSFTVKSVDPSTLGFRLDREYDISCRVGLHCAPEAHKTIGTYPEGTVRVSPGYFNSSQDIETFLEALRALTCAG